MGRGCICWLLGIVDIWVFLKFPSTTMFWVCLVIAIALIVYAAGKDEKEDDDDEPIVIDIKIDTPITLNPNKPAPSPKPTPQPTPAPSSSTNPVPAPQPQNDTVSKGGGSAQTPDVASPTCTYGDNLGKALKTIIDTRGKEALSSMTCINILSDMQAFKDIPAAKKILQDIINEGYMAKALHAQSWATESHALTTKFIHEHGTRESLATHVFQSIGFAIGFETNNSTH